MDGVRLSIEEPASPEQIHFLEQGLNEHAIEAVGKRGFNSITIVANDADGVAVGGCYGMVNWNWLFVADLWIAPNLRHKGLGSKLLAAFEAEGIKHGCKQVHLDTFSFQARPFYERQGYRVFATLEDYPPGHERHFLRKSLDPVSTSSG